MQIILLRHGLAEDHGSKPDPERVLVDKGREQARSAGHVIQATLGAPAAVWSSPLRRAVETARLVLQSLGQPAQEPTLIADLGPGGDPEHLALQVQRTGAASILLVGHQPDLGTFAARLLALQSPVELKKGGLVIVETADPTKPIARAIASLRPEQYPAILEGKEYAPWMRRALRVSGNAT